MKLLGRQLICSIAIAWCFLAPPSFADDPARSAGSTSSEAATKTPSETKTGSSTQADRTKNDSSEQEKRDTLTTESMMDDLKDPTKRMIALGNLAELLGIAAGLMLVTGSILAFLLKRYKLLGLMVAVGVIGGIAALAAPGIVHLSGSETVAVSFAIFNLIFYNAVFFLPSILAFKDNTSKKVMITLINAAGFIVPGAGLVALYLALKDKPKEAAQTVIQ